MSDNPYSQIVGGGLKLKGIGKKKKKEKDDPVAQAAAAAVRPLLLLQALRQLLARIWLWQRSHSC